MTDWAIPQQARLKYTQLFNLHDRSRTGFLSGLQCRDILMQSGLPRNILAEIWNLSDIDGDGQLTREEFILAMHLTNQARAGHALPQELSADLVPPSYRRPRSISSTSVHSVASSIGSNGPTQAATATTTSSVNDDKLSQRSVEATASTSVAAGSILNTNSFEDKRRENFEKGRAELERRRLKIIEQQTSIINEQLVKCKKQVADAKSKIDSMRSERDTKAGLITSLEAQLKTVRDRKAFLDHEEQQIMAIALDLNLINSAHSAELDQQATAAKQDKINQMKEKSDALEKEKDITLKQLAEAQSKLEETKRELKTLSEDASKVYEIYKEKIEVAKNLKQKFVEENKSKPIDLDSVWSSDPIPIVSQTNTFKSEPTSTLSSTNEDPWATNYASSSSPLKQTFDDPFAPQITASTSNNVYNNNNDSNFEPDRDYSSFLTSPKIKEQAIDGTSNSYHESKIMETGHRKMYKVQFEFVARNPDELTINPGDIIIGTETVCEPGWLSGETNGKSGLFPEAYVEPIITDEIPSKTDKGFTTNTSTNLSSCQESFDVPSLVPAQQVNQSPSVIVKYKVVYAFEARNVDELTINTGDIITGIDAPHEPGWLMGEINGQRGLFPETYVERLAEAQVDQTTDHAGTLRRGSSSGSLRSKKSRSKKAEVATVIANYRALGQEQLNLEKGQLVLIRRKMDSGWWEGELQIKANGQSQGRNGTELDHLINELVDSELDYVNDLRLCKDAYIDPLTTFFDISHIFINWSHLIEMHDSNLKMIYSKPNRKDGIDYCFIFKTFNILLNSVVDVYVDFCSRQNNSARQLEAKIASDIRFKQLVCESQRKLRKLVEQSEFDRTENNQNVNRAFRNFNLPLTTFLLKPMQRITKYELLFDRMLKVITGYEQLRLPLGRLKESAKALCDQVNEACRLKEDDQDNVRRLRWCQSHILQQSVSASNDWLSKSMINNSMSTVEINRLPSDTIKSHSLNESLTSSPLVPVEHIQFNSKTNCLGPRRLIKSGCLAKFRSGRELVVFLFNDFILLTQIKGGGSVKAENVFVSERAQQAYYKFYRQPILLEHIQMGVLDEELIQQQSFNLVCPSLKTSVHNGISKEQEDLIVSFFDCATNTAFNLIALSVKEKVSWCELLENFATKAKEARIQYQVQNSLRSFKPLSTNDSYGRLFITVLELVRITSTNNQNSSNLRNQTLDRPLSLANQSDFVQNLCIRLQLRLYKRTTHLSSDDKEKREILPTSEEFRTRTKTISNATRQPIMVEMNESMSSLDIQKDVYKFDNDCTQFLLASEHSNNPDGTEYLDIELLDDSQFRETRQIGRKRISLEQLLGRDHSRPSDNHKKLSDLPISCQTSLLRSGRGIQPLIPNRPVEMLFKLKSFIDIVSHQLDGANKNPCTSVAPGKVLAKAPDNQKFNVKLRLHVQFFCDTDSLI